MKRGLLFASAIIFVGGCVTMSGPEDFPHEEQSQAITGGSPESGYASVFALAYNGAGGCTGTCIAPRIGLTAGHCVENEPASVLSGLFGATEAAPEQTIQVTEVAIEPSYTTARNADIALLRFAEDCPSFIPANRNPLEGHLGEPVVMVGFGVTVESANDAGIKRSGVATLFSTTPSEVGGMREGELATSNDPHGTCDGDSGGPTFMTFDGTEVVVGVTSRGSETGGLSDPCGTGRSVATRSDSYIDFIDEFSNGADVPPDDDDMPGDAEPEDDDEMPSEGELGGCQSANGAGGFSAFALALVALGLSRRRRRSSQF